MELALALDVVVPEAHAAEILIISSFNIGLQSDTPQNVYR